MILWGMLRRLTVALVSITVLLASVVGMAPAANADSSTGAQGIQISPVLINLNANKGQVYKLDLKVTNVTAGPLVLTSSINDFKAKDESGTPQVILDNTGPVGTYSLRAWISPIPTFTLQSQQGRTISFLVNIPPNAEAGGHYGVIRFSGVPPSRAGQQVSLNASVGVLILARVAGNITEHLTLKQFFTEQNGHQRSVLANGPVTMVARIQNIGNVHVEPVGNLTVKNIWGKTVASYPFGSQTKNVLPGSIRRYPQTFDKSWLFGRYTANLNAAYGTTGGALLGSTTFWVIPYKLVLLALAILIVLVLIIRRSLKRYNDRVIRRHTRR
jgi:hypothetical protein